MSSLTVGVDLGGTKTAVGVVDTNGRVLARSEHDTPMNDGGQAVIANIENLVQIVTSAYEVRAVGIGAAGAVDPESGRIVAATDAIKDWAGTMLADEIQTKLGLPTVVVNDVHAHAVGEAWVGATVDVPRVLTIAVGTGIGGAFSIDGTIDVGSHFMAGHFGHVPSIEAEGLRCSCGRMGHVEAIGSGPAMHAEYLRRGGSVHVRNTRDLGRLIIEGEPIALDTVRHCGTATGRAIGGLINVLDPDIVVVAGGVSRLGDAWLNAVHRGVREQAMQPLADCPVVISHLTDAAVLGAARIAQWEVSL